MNFQPQAMPCAVNEILVETTLSQDFTGGSIDFPAGGSRLYGRDSRRSAFMDSAIPVANASRSAPDEHRAGHVAAIVREYSTQVEHHQFIFLQSFGGGPRVWQGGAFAGGDDRLERRSARPTLFHLVFDLRSNVRFPDSRPEQPKCFLHDIACQDGCLSHYGEFLRVFLRAKALDDTTCFDGPAFRPGGSFGGFQLRDCPLRRIEAHSLDSMIFQPLPDSTEERPFLQFDPDTGALLASLDGEAAVGNEGRGMRCDGERPRFAGEAGQVIPVGRMRYQETVQMEALQFLDNRFAPVCKRFRHKKIEETEVSSILTELFSRCG